MKRSGLKLMDKGVWKEWCVFLCVVVLGFVCLSFGESGDLATASVAVADPLKLSIEAVYVLGLGVGCALAGMSRTESEG